MVGLVIGSIRSLVLERASQKMSARVLENQREKAIASLDRHERTIKLGWFQTIKLEHELTEAERREQEFRIMRKIQQRADRKRRYADLALSSTSTLLLWFIGALVLMYTEKPQGWSYFVSLYFSYQSLTTIGYGDFIPTSFSGRPFFVFWVLLAVPTLTIQISHMGDTVIKAFRDLTIWLGALTLLPDDEAGLKETLKIGLHRLRSGKVFDKEQKRERGYTAEESLLDGLVDLLEQEELDEAMEAKPQSDTIDRDYRFYHFVLAKEVRQLMKDASMSPPKQYTYAEWAYYLRLIGQDECNPDRHQEPDLHHHRTPHEPDLGAAAGMHVEHKHTWSWLGIRSPLMSNQPEAEWILDRLTLKLEQQMRQMQHPAWKENRNQPPISMAEYRKRSKSSSGRAHSPRKLFEQGVHPAEIRRRHKEG